ncbi:hypothetical protein [Kribbella sp. NPDC004536]|uniref:hypothetical protein n=1 Tax=Kribbella sp. NPDC004536 TaxID=3364106 RepID=UPI003683331C
MLPGLRADALTSTPGGFELRVGLPWIRSLPLAGLSGLRLALDGQQVDPSIVLGDRRIPVDAVGSESDCWWYLQDRLVLAGDTDVRPCTVTVDFRMLVPYLSAGPGVPLVLPFHLEAELVPDQRVSPSVAGDVGTEVGR